jgi:hypothetical protein
MLQEVVRIVTTMHQRANLYFKRDRLKTKRVIINHCECQLAWGERASVVKVCSCSFGADVDPVIQSTAQLIILHRSSLLNFRNMSHINVKAANGVYYSAVQYIILILFRSLRKQFRTDLMKPDFLLHGFLGNTYFTHFTATIILFEWKTC